MLDGVADMQIALLDATLVDQRPDLDSGLIPGADDHPRHLLRDALHELVVDAALDVGAVGADARLAGVAELRGDQPVDREIEVCVVEDEVRSMPAQLE